MQYSIKLNFDFGIFGACCYLLWMGILYDSIVEVGREGDKIGKKYLDKRRPKFRLSISQSVGSPVETDCVLPR